MKELPFWFPYTQHGLLTEEDLYEFVAGENEFLITKEGKYIIDAIASWWVNPFGHSNPYIAEHIRRQAITLEHSIFAGGLYHNKAFELSKRLLEFTGNHFYKVFFSDNGSTSVEVAIKILFGYFYNIGSPRSKILALDGAYHGDTFGAMSVSERDVFTKPYHNLLFEVTFLPFPTHNNIKYIEELIVKYLSTGEYVGIILEPLVQGAGGMQMYSPELLSRIMKKVKELNHFIIADEVMTGFGKTGYMFATDSVSDVKPDIMCLSKALTGGFLPMSVTLVTEELFNAFYDLNKKEKMFLHGHSYTANPLGCAAAIASLDLFEEPETIDMIKNIEKSHKKVVESFKRLPNVKDVRHTGVILAVEIESPQAGYMDIRSRLISREALKQGVLLRPLGNVIYTIPPYIISEESLQKIYEVMHNVINFVK